MSSGRRVHERYAIELDVIVVLPGNSDDPATELRGRTQNMSLGGALITVEGAVPFGAQVKVRLLLPPLKEEAEIASTVRWLKDGAAGVQFGTLRAKEVWALNQMFKDAPPA